MRSKTSFCSFDNMIEGVSTDDDEEGEEVEK